MADWLTIADVLAHGGISPAGGDTAALTLDVAAVRAYVQRKRTDIDWDADELVVPADVRLGAAMLAWRLYQRRATPAGVIGLPDLGITQVAQDYDVARLLRIGPYGPFRFGSPGVVS